MLRIQYSSKYAAEQDLDNPITYKAVPNSVMMIPDPLLYRTPDYTNLNVWGFFATAEMYLYIIAASHWIALLSPLVLPLKFLALAVSTGSRGFIEGIYLLGSRRCTESDSLPMDTWHTPQENDKPDDPLRRVNNQATRARY